MNREGSFKISDHFRVVCLQIIFCKLMDIIILCRGAGTLMTCVSQFSFKQGLSAGLYN